MNRHMTGALPWLHFSAELGDEGMFLLMKYAGDTHALVKDLQARERAEIFFAPLSDDDAMCLVRAQPICGDSVRRFISERRATVRTVGAGHIAYHVRAGFGLTRVAEHPRITPAGRECIVNSAPFLMRHDPTSDSVLFWHPGLTVVPDTMETVNLRKFSFIDRGAGRPSAAELAGLLLTRWTNASARSMGYGQWFETSTRNTRETMCMRINRQGLLEVAMFDLTTEGPTREHTLITPVVAFMLSEKV